MFKIYDDKVYFVAKTPDINKVIEIFLPKDDRGTIMDSHEIRVDLCRAIRKLQHDGYTIIPDVQHARPRRKVNVSKPITNGAERDGDVMRSHLRAEPIINAKRDTPYNMKTQKEIGLLGEKVCRNFLIDCCAKHRFGFVRFEDVRDVKMYQERDIDFIVYTSSGKTITLDAKADTYTTGNIFLEIYVPGFKLGKNGVPIAKYTENGERAGQKPGWLFRGADFIFYCFLNTKEIFVFDRECATYYACECAISGMPLIPIYRTAKNDENRGDNRNYYGMGICPNALRMMNSNIMRNHMWLCHFQKGPYYNPYTKTYDHPKKSA